MEYDAEEITFQIVNSRWTPPRYILKYPESKHDAVRKKYNILVEGEDVPPPIKTFKV